MTQRRKVKHSEATGVPGSPGFEPEAIPVSRNLVSLHRALTVVRGAVAPDITVQRLMILLAVYANEGLSQRELLETLEGCSITALSRNLADLSRLTSKKRPGPGLVEARPDPMNLRLRRVYMTPKGRRLVNRIDRALGGEGAQSTKARSKT
jgi:DNA-binding MarR family transcriptional regulator